MARPLTRAQCKQNAAFLRVLRRTGNIRMAAREVGAAVSTLHTRRAAHPGFAQRWDAAVAVAHAAFWMDGGRQGPERKPEGKDAAPETAHRTKGGEPVVVRRRDGKLQLRRAQPGKLTQACEQAFLAALSATANVSLSAAAAGASERAFHRRRRTNGAFAREWRLAMEAGYNRLEEALLEHAAPESYEHDAWRRNEPPPMPRMTPSEMVHLMHLHQKEVRLQDEPPHIRRRAGESQMAYSYRLSAMGQAQLEQRREEYRVAEAERRAQGRACAFDDASPSLPALDQVTGWSHADPDKPAHHEGVPLFGGWRMDDMDARLAERKRDRAERRRLREEDDAMRREVDHKLGEETLPRRRAEREERLREERAKQPVPRARRL